jgi:hypothetical protein
VLSKSVVPVLAVVVILVTAGLTYVTVRQAIQVQDRDCVRTGQVSSRMNE